MTQMRERIIRHGMWEPSAVADPRRRRRGPRILAVYSLLPALFLCAIVIAPVLPLPDPRKQNVADAFRPPVLLGGDWTHPLGTDQLGRDLLARVLFGGQDTLVMVISALLIGAVVGAVLGLMSGAVGGVVDLVISRLIDAQMALPVILLAMVVAASGPRTVGSLILVFAIISWAQTARLVRAEALSLSERMMVTSLVAAGASTQRIIWRHLLPNVLPTVAVAAMMQLGALFLVEAGLAYLGLGVAPPSFSWGSMLADGRNYLFQGWWIVAVPGLVISLTVLHINIYGDLIRSRLDPTLQRH